MNPTILENLEIAKIESELQLWRILRKTTVRILFVTDSNFSQLDTVYEFMNNNSIGCTRFSVKRAMYSYANSSVVINNNPGDGEAHYENFKFNSTNPDGSRVLDDFDVMFIFAVNSGDPSSLEDDELSVLHKWMNDGHGVFATGDHATLGQRLASRIPRVGTMRKWTDADQVPPAGTDKRIDTNQPDPTNANQLNGSEVIPIGAQSDEYPQPITCLPFRTSRLGVSRVIEYPHEVLCHPTLGKINVMPDHPHEGECFNPSDIPMNGDVDFDTSVADKKEYPTHNLHQEKPKIIATGRNAHQYLQAKGDLDPYVFNMISVYDGHKSNVGRVAVDSTWHHWYNMNIDELKTAGGRNWQKIGRYFLNLAKYLAPKGLFRNRCLYELVAAQLRYPFNEEVFYVREKLDLMVAGRSLKESLISTWGKCATISFVLRHICEINPSLCRELERHVFPEEFPIDPDGPLPECLSCPPPDIFLDAVFGGITEAMQPVTESLLARFNGKKPELEQLKADEIEKMVNKGLEIGIEQFQKRLSADIKRTESFWLN